MSEPHISEDHIAELTRLDLGYWWYAVRQAHVESILARVARSGPFSYLDFGCGTGIVAEGVVRRFQPREVLAVDGTAEALEVSERRGLPVQQVHFGEPFAVPFAPDVVTSMDVLEHLDDPVSALLGIARASAPDATLIVSVPAMPSLTSRWDELSGHRRRYTRRLLREQLRAGGWAPTRIRYIFSYCVPPVWVQRNLLRRVQRFEFPVVSAPLNALMTAAGRLEFRLGSPLPFGTSLLAVATREER